MRDALAHHDEMLRDAIEMHGGHVVKTTGDGFHAAFAHRGGGGRGGGRSSTRSCREAWTLPTPLQVRMGLHTGAASLRDGDYFGSVLNRAARLMGVGAWWADRVLVGDRRSGP